MLRKTLIGLAASLALAAGSSSALAQGTAITYQGRLQNSGALVNTPTDMQFSLWNDPVLSAPANQVGSTITQTNVTVNNGLFTTGLEFGVNPYTADQALWLQIAVRNPAGSGSYVTMGARQKLTPAPFSLATRGMIVDAGGSPRFPSDFVTIGDGTMGPNLLFDDIPNAKWQLSTSGFSLNFLNDNGGSFNSKMTITNSGNVGIGTTPGFPLDVSGRMRVRASAATGSGGIWYTDDDSPETNRSFVGRGGSADRWTGVFSGTPGNPWPLIVKDSGNVGIGTTTPGQKLDVAGNIKIRSNDAFYFGTPTEETDGIYFSRYQFASDQSVLELILGDNPAGGAGNDAFVISTRSLDGAVTTDRFQFNSNGEAFKPGGGSWAGLSDERTKNEIQPLSGTLDRLLQLKGHSYTYKPEFVENGSALPGTQIGLVAQEVETVFPDWVSTGPKGLKMVTERSTTALMVEALRDLRNEKDAEISTLKARLEQIEALLAAQAANAAK